MAGLAAGPDGLYFTELYKDVNYTSAIDRGARILRISYVGDAASPVHAIPGTIQAEDFDAGGEGVGYHDTTPGNQGGVYRIERCGSRGGDRRRRWVRRRVGRTRRVALVPRSMSLSPERTPLNSVWRRAEPVAYSTWRRTAGT